MRKPFKPIWQYLMADAESEELRVLQRYRERFFEGYPDLVEHNCPLPRRSLLREIVHVGFMLLFVYVAYSWWCRMTGGQP